MSERINVQEAFDPELRKAQAEFDDYIDSRPYQDSKGNIHDAQTGAFISNPNSETESAYYDRMMEHSSSETDTRYDGKSLKELAEMVRDARSVGDMTSASDAEAVFFEKFSDMAEKFDWEGKSTNRDGEIEDRGAIADKRLEHYTSIMYGETSSDEKLEKNTEESDNSSIGTPNDENDSTNEVESSTPELKSDIVADASRLLPDAEVALNDPNVSEEEKDRIRAALKSMVDEIDSDTAAEKPASKDSKTSDEDEQNPAEKTDEVDDTKREPLLLESTESVLSRSDITDERKEDILRDLEANKLEDRKKRKFGAGVLAAIGSVSTSVYSSLQTRAYHGASKLVEKYQGTSRRRRFLMGGAALAAIGAGMWLSRNNWGFGQDVMEQAGGAAGNGGTGPTSPTLDGGSGSIIDTLAAKSFNVEKGHGYTQELIELGNSLGHKKMTPEQSYELYKSLSSEYGKDFIDIGKNGKDIYTLANGDTGLAQTGSAKWSKGVVESADKWMTRLGL